MKRYLFFLLTVVLLLIKTFIPFYSSETFSENEFIIQKLQDHDQHFPHQKLLLVNFEDHNPIDINGKTDFRDQAEDEGWIGNGTVSNPYIINYLAIYGSSSDDLFGFGSFLDLLILSHNLFLSFKSN